MRQVAEVAVPVTLESEAAWLDQRARDVVRDQQLAGGLGLDSSAYGPLCAVLAAELNVLGGVVIDAFGVAAESLYDTGQRLRLAAEAYAAGDEAAVTGLASP